MLTYSVFYKHKLEDEWTAINGVVRPFVLTDVLDETLAGGYVNVSGIDEKPSVRPFDFIYIFIKQDAHQPVAKVFKAANIHTAKTRFAENEYKYEVRIDLVELTKDLERIVCDTLTFTNYLGKTYPSGGVLVRPDIWMQEAGVTVSVQPPNFYGPVATGVPVRIYSSLERLWSPASSFSTTRSFTPNDHHKITLKRGETTVFEYEGDGNAVVPDGHWIFAQPGTYTLVYEGTYTRIFSFAPPGGQLSHPAYKVTFDFGAVEDIPTLADWTISSVVQRILDVGKTARVGIDLPMFEPFGQHEYDNVPAPEFYITRSTMFDALMTVGGAIHAIPRLDYSVSENKIYLNFTKLGGNIVKETMPPLIFEEREWNADEYSGVFDSTVENMMNTRDLIGGAVVEPSRESFKTVRSSPGEVRICADTMEVLTQFPIQQVVKVEISIPYNGAIEVYDITPFVYEEAEYNALSEYNQNASYPYSKAWAIFYRQGGNRISGLNFRLKDAVNFREAFQKFAIVNIIETVSGHSITQNALIDIAFRVTYIPRVTARLKQYKPVLGNPFSYVSDGTTPSHRNELIYNQSGNSVESFYYGERLRGAAARLGNEIVTRTYVFDGPDEIPECGDIIMVDGRKMYLAIINQEFDRLHIRATLKMTPNFNKLNEWVGLDSNYRLYDVSEKQTAQRLINYSETCVISRHHRAGGAHPLITGLGVGLVRETFAQTDLRYRPRWAYLQADTDLAGELVISRIALPISANGVGNSLCFSTMFPDNYGAGYQAIGDDAVFKTGIEQQFTRVARNVPYGDAYGRLPYLEVELRDAVFAPSAASQTDNEGASNLLPEMAARPEYGIATFATAANPLRIGKDSREQLSLTFQQHFQAETDDIVIGKLLIQNNLLVTDAKQAESWEVRSISNPGTATATTTADGWSQSGGVWTQALEWPVHHWLNTGDTTSSTSTEFAFALSGGSWSDWALVPDSKPSWTDAQIQTDDFSVRVWRSADAIYTQTREVVKISGGSSPGEVTRTDLPFEMKIRSGIISHVSGKVCLLTEPLNALRQHLDPTTIVETDIPVDSIVEEVSDVVFSINSFTNPDTSDRIYTGWAIVDTGTMEYYIGVNEPMTPGGHSSRIFFNFLDNHVLEE